MPRFEGIVASIPEGGAADVTDGNEAFHFVMAGAVHNVGETDGKAGSGGFDADEERAIIHHPVGEQDFLAAAVAHVSGGGVIESAENRNTTEQPGVLVVPEGMRLGRVGGRDGCNGGRQRRIRGRDSRRIRLCGRREGQQQDAQQPENGPPRK